MLAADYVENIYIREHFTTTKLDVVSSWNELKGERKLVVNKNSDKKKNRGKKQVKNMKNKDPREKRHKISI